MNRTKQSTRASKVLNQGTVRKPDNFLQAWVMVRAQRSAHLTWRLAMDQYTYNDTPTDEEMLDWLGGLHGGEIITNALGQPITMPSDYHWRNDLIWVDQQLKAMANARHVLDHQRLIQPEAFGAETVVLAPDPLLDTLTTVFTVLVTMFHKTDIGQYYRPSPYATRFLWAFGQCAYLQKADSINHQH